MPKNLGYTLLSGAKTPAERKFNSLLRKLETLKGKMSRPGGNTPERKALRKQLMKDLKATEKAVGGGPVGAAPTGRKGLNFDAASKELDAVTEAQEGAKTPRGTKKPSGAPKKSAGRIKPSIGSARALNPPPDPGGLPAGFTGKDTQNILKGMGGPVGKLGKLDKLKGVLSKAKMPGFMGSLMLGLTAQQVIGSFRRGKEDFSHTTDPNVMLQDAQDQRKIQALESRVATRDPELYQILQDVAAGRPPARDITDNEVTFGGPGPATAADADPAAMRMLLSNLGG